MAALDLKYKIFVIYVATLNVNLSDEMYPSKKAQIAHLKLNKAPIKVFSKYTDFVNIFSSKLVVKLFKYMKINNHIIQLVDN